MMRPPTFVTERQKAEHTRQKRRQVINLTESTCHFASPPGGVQVFVMVELPLNESRSATIWKQLSVMPEVPLNVSVSFGK